VSTSGPRASELHFAEIELERVDRGEFAAELRARHRAVGCGRILVDDEEQTIRPERRALADDRL
jgi:hypothetical protein